ncbi:hypothetical protein DHEL01_v209708 [Diaporthe helianthi]|uniref:Uncharacterized protein n=1 Tax=Diaporthe helianthi TaxID=158607 RepID=A0A2P5HNT6_DIAHE|nr:hypothetical protein DHEL01_v209708 [Diaporthe helianthi]
MLQVGMTDTTSKTPSWVQLESLDLTQHIDWICLEEYDDFEKHVQETFATKLDERFPDLSIQQPGWWITIVRQADAPMMDLLLTWNLPQFGAVGANVFHEDSIVMLNEQTGARERTELDGDILRLPQAMPLTPTPIEDLTSLPLGARHLAKSIWEEIRPPFLSRDASKAGWCPIRTTPYETQYRAFFIEGTSLVTVLKLCRKNKTTIAALIHRLPLITFSSHLNSKAALAFESSPSIVDYRRNPPPAPQDVPWVSYDRAVANYHLSADVQRELWAVSARSRQEIMSRLDQGLRKDLVGMFKHVRDWQQTMRDQARSPVPTWDMHKWSIARAKFGLSAEVPAAAIEFSPVSAAGGGG